MTRDPSSGRADASKAQRREPEASAPDAPQEDAPYKPATPGQRNDPLPKLIWFLGCHAGIGVAVGMIFVTAVYQMNISGLRDLLHASSEPLLPLFILYFSTALSFGSLNMGIAVMTLPWDPPPDDGRQDGPPPN
ncbi:MAG: hypothetical protein AAFV45_07540 [Pseudomonadota bacterium]